MPGLPAGDPDGLTALVNTIDNNYHASATQAALISRMKKFQLFLTTFKLWTTNYNGSNPSVPNLEVTHLIFFATWLLQSGQHKSYSSINQYTSSVRQWAKANDRQDPALDPHLNTPSIRWVRFNKSLKRHMGGKINKRKPLATDKCKLMVAFLKTGLLDIGIAYLDVTAAILLAWFALLRVSEYTTKSKSDIFDATKHATRGDVEFFPDQHNPIGMRFTVKVSKTDQFRVGHELTIYKSGNPSFCAVTAMHSLFKEDPTAQPSDPLFDFTNRTFNSQRPSQSRSMSRTNYSIIFKALLTQVGISAEEIQFHSLRSGGATALLRAGVPPIIVTKLGRWKSWCWTTYTWATTHHIRQAHEALGSHLESSVPVDLDAIRTLEIN
jgi:integrase